MVSEIEAETETMPELLDTTLRERKMKRILLIAVAALVLMQGAYALEIFGITIGGSPEPVINEASPIMVEQTLAVKVESSYSGESILDTVFRVTGFGRGGSKNITVTFEGVDIAVIPSGVKIENMPIHKSCLSENFQYGSEEWYACEVNRI